MPMDYLTVSSGEKTFQREVCPDGLSIGRSSQNDLVLEDPGVSRSHARIARFADGFYLIDAGGKNGTFINERRVVAPTLLRGGDAIRVGSTSMVFNGTASSPVEFVDVPLPVGPTTFLQVRETVTPSGAFLRSGPGVETDPAIRA